MGCRLGFLRWAAELLKVSAFFPSGGWDLGLLVSSASVPVVKCGDLVASDRFLAFGGCRSSWLPVPGNVYSAGGESFVMLYLFRWFLFLCNTLPFKSAFEVSTNLFLCLHKSSC